MYVFEETKRKMYPYCDIHIQVVWESFIRKVWNHTNIKYWANMDLAQKLSISDFDNPCLVGED